MQFPAGGVQRVRFKNISDALGTRNPAQVAGRWLRFSKRLAAMGLPPP